MSQFICTKSWKRHTAGAILTEWEYNKLPENIKTGNFMPYETPVVKKTKQVVKDVPVQPLEFVVKPSSSVLNVPESKVYSDHNDASKSKKNII